MNLRLSRKWINRGLLILASGLFTSGVFAQISGVQTVPGTYATIDAFITDINAVGVGPGGVALNIAPGYAETAPVGGYVITATGTAANQIVIGSASLPKPIITANSALVAGSLTDAIFKIVGGDYITISGLDLRSNPANTITAAATNNMTEWGIALLYASTSNGAQNISIIGNDITLDRTYQNTFAIYANATHAATTPTTSATAIAGGGNNGLLVYGNTITNTNIGILVVGPTGAADHNDGIDIGGTSAANGNTITNFGTTGTFSSYANVSGTVNGILIRNSKNVNISYNNIASSIGGVTAGTLNGIQFPTFSNTPTGVFTQTVSFNNISLQHGLISGTINGINIAGTNASTTSGLVVNNNNFLNFDHTTATGSGSVTFITNGSAYLNQSISNNTFTNLNLKTTGSVTFISNSHTLPAGGTKNVNGNSIVTAFQKTGAGGTITLFTDNGSDPAGAINNTNNNNFSNISATGATVIAGWANTNGGSPTKTVTGNTFNNWIGGTSNVTALTVSFSGSSNVSGNIISNISGGAQVVGISTGSGTETLTNNTVFNLSSTGPNGVGGIFNSGGTAKIIERNKIYGLSSSNATGFVNGILSSSGTSVIITNNVISGLSAPVANAANPLAGISITGGTATELYYNSVYINGTSSGANFGSSAVSVATGTNVTLRNNIFINESVANGTGFTAAYRRSSTTLTSYQAASNRNLFYAGVPSTTNLIMYDGTNSYQTLAAYQTAMVTRDLNSITGEAFAYGTPGSFFTSLTGASADFLRPVAAVVTQVESGAVNITSPLITLDYTSAIRAGNAGYTGTGTRPDIGAYEFEGVTPAPVVTLNSVTPPASPVCFATPRTVSVEITTSAGTITGANVLYAFNGVAQTPIAMTFVSGTTWEAVIPSATPANASVTWSVVATNSLGINTSLNGTTYSDEPLTGVTAAASATNTTVCSGTSSALSATLIRNASVPSGAGGGTSSSSSVSPFYHGYGGVKTQYIFRASELTAMGLTAGNITALSINVTSLGTTVLNGFSINMGHTAQTAAIANTAITTGLTTVYPSTAQTLVSGANTFAITPFNWDGVSNVVISFNYSNNNSGGTSTTVTTDPTLSFVASMAIYADNATEACLLTAPASGQACMGLSFNGTSSLRPRFVFTGATFVPITSVTWMDGPTTVGTGNPLTVNPTATTTYSANVTASGCVVSPSPTVTVNTLALPATPTRLNSAQCGTQIPTASVTSTSGLPTPTFNWYTVPTGGTAAQSDVATTYLSTVAATTTFYVSELNTVTGCESARVAVTVTVAIADGILASTSAATICIGNPVTLTATNTNGTPNQTYTYTWTNATAGSGLTSVTGASTIVTPTLPGTYTYDLTGVDGACSAISSVSVTVDPFVATVAAINVSCNGYNNGSFSVASSTCGTSPYSYSVDGGMYVTTIPTNLTPGAHTVIIRDANLYESSLLSFNITEPSLVISAPTTTSVAVCVGGTSAMVSGTSSTNQTAPQTLNLPLNIAAQPVEVNSAPGNVVTTVTVPALPAGAVVTGVTINVNGLIPNGNSYQSEVRLGLSGLFTNAAAAGTGAIGFGTVAGTPFNYTRAFTPVGFPITGGALNLLYWESSNDVSGGDDCTFPIGSSVGSIVITYTTPVPATLSWWTAPTGGSQIGTSSPFEVVGTSALLNTSTAGVYTVYAQGENSGCASLSRTAATVTVNAPSTSTTAVTNCGPYMWNGISRPTTGTYTFTTTNSVGCDSVATLNLTVNSPSASSTTVTNCGPYMWNGISRTASGTYTFVTPNAVGCDSTATLILTVNALSASTTTIVECAPYTWTNGTTYSATGIYTQTLVNAAGCDSIATLDFTLGVPTTSTTTITACDSYDWTNGMTYTATGIYTQVLTNAAGCDSTATLDLTINVSTTGSESVTECATYTWSANGMTYTTGGMYTAVLTNAAGCDSTVTLDLTITLPTTGAESASACSSYTWPTNGMTYTTAGMYTATLTNAAGCDSVVTLTLTITGLTATATNNGDATLTASTGASYVWIDCTTNTAIAGATAQTFAPTVNGNYAVVVTNAAGCSDTSSCVTIGNVGIKEIAGEGVSIFPNPTASDVVINFPSNTASIEVMDAQGKVVSTTTIKTGENVSLGAYDRGVYYIRLQTENGTSIHKVVKN